MNLRNKNKKWPLFLIIMCLLTLVNTSCSKKNYSSKAVYNFKSITGKPDYSDLSYWAAHPWKWDPSDSVSKPLQKKYMPDTSVDVFFIHPTTFINFKDLNWNALIDDSALNAKTDYSTILYQASVFNESCRVFAPRYRQAHLKSFFTNNSVAAKNAFDMAYGDVRDAFMYYMKNWNKGRPVIIASHSQGTVHAGRLLKEFFEGTELQNKLVCAYIIGMPVTETYFDKIPVCKDSTQTGCYVSWRTYKTGYTEPNYIAKETFSCKVVNPLTWTTDTSVAKSSLNKGGILKNYNKIIPGVVNAGVHKNILWTSKPKFFGNIFLKKRNYHIADINFFYMNIRQNIKTRISAFWKQ